MDSVMSSELWGQYWGQNWFTPISSTTCTMGDPILSKFTASIQPGGGHYPGGQGCCSGGPGQAREMGQQGPHEVQQGQM